METDVWLTKCQNFVSQEIFAVLKASRILEIQGSATVYLVAYIGGAQSLTWNANAANQISERETPDARWVLGRAHPEAALAVTGGGAAVREGAEFAVPVTMADAEQSEWRAVSITASRQGVGRNGGDVSQTREGKLWLPASPESFTYDADGNLTADGRWSYKWDAENRLKAMQTLPAAAAAGVPAQRLEFAYDAQSRRIRKLVKEWNDASGSFSPVHDHRFLYDGWNLVAEFKADPLHPSSFILQTSFAWGLDLSGTEQGAGGVGGLLLVEQPSTFNSQPSTALAPCYDGNGNITAYVHLESGAVQAKFDYDPFGKPVWTDLSGTGDLPPFRFSTKYEDAETGLVYYGYRYYSPELGRWLSRDPIEEEGGLNLYGMVGNDAVNKWDVLGRKEYQPCFIKLYLGHGNDVINKLSQYNQEFLAATENAVPISASWTKENYARASGLGCDFNGSNSYFGFDGYISPTGVNGKGQERLKLTQILGGSAYNGIGMNQENSFYQIGPMWNGGYNPSPMVVNGAINWDYHNQAAGYLKLVSENWVAALNFASNLASKGKNDKNRCCREVKVILAPAGGDIHRIFEQALNSLQSGLYSGHINSRAITFGNLKKGSRAPNSLPRLGEVVIFNPDL